MSIARDYYVYIMTGHNRRLYIGVTNNLARRVLDHRTKAISGFTAQYNLTRLAYFEQFSDVKEAIAREKQIKGWTREKKLTLVESMNPNWFDLGDDLFSDEVKK